jgi:3-hydroxyisobutyrate dehydrogenase
MPRTVGFIGLGIMGFSMAKRLIEAGHTVTVYNRTASKGDPLVALGAKKAATPREAAKGNEIVISIVTDSPDVEAVMLGPDGAVHSAEKSALFIDMSTIAPETARKVGQALKSKGIAFLDAPVTGGDVGAREGTLSILVGGEKSDLERAREVFAVMGKRITHCGPSGAGQTVKACNQILCALNMIGICEALHLARLNGIDQSLVVEALSAGAGGSWALEKLGSRIAKGDFNPGFMVDLILKDLRIVQDAAKRVGLPLEGSALAQNLFGDNQSKGEGKLGTQVMYKALERKSLGGKK